MGGAIVCSKVLGCALRDRKEEGMAGEEMVRALGFRIRH